MDRMPIELGHRLPEEVRAALLHDLRDGGPFLGAHGFATEDFDSPQYIPPHVNGAIGGRISEMRQGACRNTFEIAVPGEIGR